MGGARWLVAGVSLVAAVVIVVPLSGWGSPALADGPTGCTAGPPPDPYHGFCATYSGANTFYGSYGPGFPTSPGWAWCANSPAGGGDYPVPAYGYVPVGVPGGANVANGNALGFAFSETESLDGWNGEAGRFTADQEAVAGKIIYDAVVWGTPVPAMDPGVGAAFNAINFWYVQSIGLSGQPAVTMGLAGGATTVPQAGTSVVLHVQYPGTGAPTQGLPLLLSITGGTFYTPGGPTATGVSTDAGGNAAATIFPDPGSTSVTVSAVSNAGQPGIYFQGPSALDLAAQRIVSFLPPGLIGTSASYSVLPPALANGTVSVQKSVDDGAYYGAAGAQFQVFDASNNLLATLTTDAAGATGPSGNITAGTTVRVHESSAPAGYAVAPDQSVTIVAFTNVVVQFTGANGDHVVPATVTIAKADAQSGAPLSGAVFDVRYDSANTGLYNVELGTCTTSASGTCSPPGNDGGSLLPGNYQVAETQAPPGYWLNPAATIQTISLTPGEAGAVSFSDLLLGSLQLTKSGDDTAYQAVVGAVFTVTGPAPSTATVGTLTVGSGGQTNVLGGLVPGTYTLTETTVPTGYTPVPPFQVAVTAGRATTQTSALDKIQPAILSLRKVDRETGASLAGAVFDVRYDSANSGTYDTDLGSCTTSASGMCSPPGNDGSSLLPGNYQVTETQAPPGYALDPATAVQAITLVPGQVGSLTFSDPLLVPVAFSKTPTGNFDPATVQLAGAVFAIHQGTPTGPIVASCTTDATGRCTTTAALWSGSAYCWVETVAPPGLSANSGGCFAATNDTGATPIIVDEPGKFVNVQVHKVVQGAPSISLPGAVFDLYRMDHGAGPSSPAPPADAIRVDSGTWVSRSTTSTTGDTSFPLQFPGYAYCVLEHQAPPDYELDPTERCTGVLAGTTSVPAPVLAIIAPDTPSLITLGARKYNTKDPNTVIPGATYNLYVQGNPPPGYGGANPPADVAPESGDAWFARATTDAEGRLSFSIPAGFAWCLLEVAPAPANYVLDPALHCTAVLTTSSPQTATTLALPETLAEVNLTAHKFNTLEPHTVIPGATYDLYVQGRPPPGYSDPPPADGVMSATGDEWYARGTTDAHGDLSFTVPAGYAWCLHEEHAPPEYQLDPSMHCTAVLTTSTPPSADAVALPETPSPLPFTGGPNPAVPVAGFVAIGLGALMLTSSRRRRLRVATGETSPGAWLQETDPRDDGDDNAQSRKE